MTATLDRKETYRVWDTEGISLESNFFPVIYNGELRVLDLWLSDCLGVEISEKMYLKVFTRRILVDEKIFIMVIHAEKT